MMKNDDFVVVAFSDRFGKNKYLRIGQITKIEGTIAKIKTFASTPSEKDGNTSISINDPRIMRVDDIQKIIGGKR